MQNPVSTGSTTRSVTKARGGQSWHNFGLAWDIGLFRGGVYLESDVPYEPLGVHGKVPGVAWGGDWTGFKDRPHYQFGTDGQTVSAARSRFENGCQ